MAKVYRTGKVPKSRKWEFEVPGRLNIAEATAWPLDDDDVPLAPRLFAPEDVREVKNSFLGLISEWWVANRTRTYGALVKESIVQVHETFGTIDVNKDYNVNYW